MKSLFLFLFFVPSLFFRGGNCAAYASGVADGMYELAANEGRAMSCEQHEAIYQNTYNSCIGGK